MRHVLVVEMYTFIVLKKWLNWILDNENDLAVFLSEVGTPCILTKGGSQLGSTYNGVPGFYIKVPPGWGIRYNYGLLQESLQLVNAEHPISLAISETVDETCAKEA